MSRYFCWALIITAAGCVQVGTSAMAEPAHYLVRRVATTPKIDADWEKPVWQDVEPVELTLHMGERPKHFPRTLAKVVYDDKALYVIFRVDDRYVRAATEANQGNVCWDSCAEFFFIPEDDTTRAYFNLEMNCGGTMLLHYQTIPRVEPVLLPENDLAKIEIAHSQPRIVDPEIAEPTVWTVEYRLPVELVAKYYPLAKRPAPGVVWRANFYKCADKTSHPHWLTWSLVDLPSPNFHVPEYFGTLVFE